jgi:hypothetical protein
MKEERGSMTASTLAMAVTIKEGIKSGLMVLGIFFSSSQNNVIIITDLIR